MSGRTYEKAKEVVESGDKKPAMSESAVGKAMGMSQKTINRWVQWPDVNTSQATNANTETADEGEDEDDDAPIVRVDALGVSGCQTGVTDTRKARFRGFYGAFGKTPELRFTLVFVGFSCVFEGF